LPQKSCVSPCVTRGERKWCKLHHFRGARGGVCFSCGGPLVACRKTGPQLSATSGAVDQGVPVPPGTSRVVSTAHLSQSFTGARERWGSPHPTASPFRRIQRATVERCEPVLIEGKIAAGPRANVLYIRAMSTAPSPGPLQRVIRQLRILTVKGGPTGPHCSVLKRHLEASADLRDGAKH